MLWNEITLVQHCTKAFALNTFMLSKVAAAFYNHFEAKYVEMK